MSEAFFGEETEEMMSQMAGEMVHGVPAAPFKGKRVLMLDDNLQTLRLYGQFLERLVGEEGSFEPVAYTVGDYAPNDVITGLRDAILALEPDIVLFDYELDRCCEADNGMAVLAEIRRFVAGSINIICIGFSSALSTRQKFIEAGADDFVLKNPTMPVSSLEELSAKLEEVYGRSDRTRTCDLTAPSRTR